MTPNEVRAQFRSVGVAPRMASTVLLSLHRPLIVIVWPMHREAGRIDCHKLNDTLYHEATHAAEALRNPSAELHGNPGDLIYKRRERVADAGAALLWAKRHGASHIITKLRERQAADTLRAAVPIEREREAITVEALELVDLLQVPE